MNLVAGDVVDRRLRQQRVELLIGFHVVDPRAAMGLSSSFHKIKPADTVLVHAGLVVSVLTVDEARDVEAAFAELGVLQD